MAKGLQFDEALRKAMEMAYLTPDIAAPVDCSKSPFLRNHSATWPFKTELKKEKRWQIYAREYQRPDVLPMCGVLHMLNTREPFLRIVVTIYIYEYSS